MWQWLSSAANDVKLLVKLTNSGDNIFHVWQSLNRQCLELGLLRFWGKLENCPTFISAKTFNGGKWEWWGSATRWQMTNMLSGLRLFTTVTDFRPSVLWRCWLGGRKGIRPVKNWVVGLLAWSSVWSEVQTCIQPGWCHCHSLSLASVRSRLVLTFWYRLTWVVPEKGR